MLNLDLAIATRYICEKRANLVMVKRGRVIAVKNGRGIRPLLELFEEHGSFKDCILGDKIVGHAAALLMVNAGVAGVYGGIISKPAIKLLKNAGVIISYGESSKTIMNRHGTDSCPMEKLAETIVNPGEAPERIKMKLEELAKGD